MPQTLAQLLMTVPGARLLDVSADAAAARAAAQVTVDDVTLDSRSAGPGILFACRPGARFDGHDFAPLAVAAGSPALLVERPLPLPVPQIAVPSVAAAVGPLAAALHGHPSADLLLLGVTGTNGKTTTAFLLEAILQAAGHRSGLIGTVETRVAGVREPGVRTTPEAPDLQRLLARMRAAGVTAAAMEVSSHGLALGRVAATRFAAALFTNLTQDHLDFHADLEDYFAAKATLFTPEHTGLAVINVDDPWGRRLADELAGDVLRVSARAGGANGGGPPDVVAADVIADRHGARLTAVLPGGRLPLRSHLPGHFNVANVLLAVAAATAVGIPPEAAAAGVASLRGVPGRMERVDVGQPFGVLVDYAHTPDSVENVLRAVRELTDGRVLVLLGCGGDRDRAKRPLMGRAAVSLADVAVLTTDNPRSEDPAAILEQVAAGAASAGTAAGRWCTVLDRREAIATILSEARPGDVVVLAGKGHETYQELATGRIPFDDREVARSLLLQQLAGEAGSRAAVPERGTQP